MDGLGKEISGSPSTSQEAQGIAPVNTAAEELRDFRREQYVKANPHDRDGVMFNFREAIRDMRDTFRRLGHKEQVTKEPTGSDPEAREAVSQAVDLLQNSKKEQVGS